MLEATDGQTHYIYYTPAMEEARSRGRLRTNSFVRLRERFSEGHPALKIEQLGDSESILRNKRFLRETVQRLIGRGIATEEAGWNGWLGRYQRALHAGRRLWNTNALGNESSSKKTEAVDCDACIPVEMPTWSSTLVEICARGIFA